MGVVVESPVLTIESPTFDYGQPSLVVAGPDAASAAVVFSEQELPKAPTAEIGVLEGWGAWPPAGPTPVKVHDHGSTLPGTSLLAASLSTPTATPTHLGVLFSGKFSGFAIGIDFDGANTQPLFSSDGGDAVIVSPNAPLLAYLSAFSKNHGANWVLNISAGTGSSGLGAVYAGCATSSIAADAAAVPNGWLLAAALGTPLGGTPAGFKCPGSGAVGPPTTIHVAQFSSNFGTVQAPITETQSIASGHVVTRLRMAPGPKGAWMVWGVYGAKTLTGAEVGMNGHVDGPKFSIEPLSGALVPESAAVETLGEGLVVAAAERQSSGPDQILVDARVEGGVAAWKTVVPAGGTVGGAVSVRASPKGDALLVAWAELPAGGTQHRIRIARLDCTNGL